MALILLSNDDGIGAPGIEVLREGLSDLGDIYVVAPYKEMSGASHSITLRKNIEVKRMGDKIFAVEGTPADCTLLALYGLLPRKPDIKVSGINRGYNLGEDVFYSGTVAAAREGVIYGTSALAVSIGDEGPPFYWESALHFTRLLIRKIVGLKPRVFLLNLNVPNRTLWEIKGIKWTRLGTRLYKDPVEKVDNEHYRIGGRPLWIHQPGTDLEAIENGYASVSPLRVDLTDDEILREMERIFNF